MNRYCSLLLSVMVAMLFDACGSKSKTETRVVKEDREAMSLLQGVWQDEETEEVSFWVKGDTIFYPDSMSQPAPFVIADNQLVLLSTDAHYHIEKQTPHVFWFVNQSGDVVHLVKSEDPLPDELIRGEQQRVMTYTEVVKQDSVVFFDNQRSDDGMEVDNIYYDNIMHVSLFRGADKLFSRDFRKQDYAAKVPAQFLSQSVLSNMEYAGVDARGFRFVATICIPDGATCYKAENLISFDGKLTIKLIEY